ncbi:eCIS core domain-containing protein [Deinococcus sp. UYEF24]
MDYDDSAKRAGPERTPRPKAQADQVQTDQTKRLAVPAAGVSPRVQRQAQAAQARAGEALVSHTLRPVALQRQQLSGVLSALTLDRDAGEGLASERAAVQRQIDERRASLPGGEARASVPQGSAPSTPGMGAAGQVGADWVSLARAEVQRVEDPLQPGQTRWLSAADRERHVGTLRAVGQGLARDFRADRGPPLQRYAEYGERLATLQRQSLTRTVPNSVLAQLSPVERPLLQRAIGEAVQRQAEQEQQSQAASTLGSLQRQLDELGAEAGQPLTRRIEARRGSGQPLSAEVRRALEVGLNHDLSGVRVHTDSEAHLLARKLNAAAFTSGRDIFFQSGRFDPNSRSGTELLAHEVAHVQQQAQGRVGRGIDPDAGLETEARSFGQRFAADRERGGESRQKSGPRQKTNAPAPPRRLKGASSVSQTAEVKATDGRSGERVPGQPTASEASAASAAPSTAGAQVQVTTQLPPRRTLPVSRTPLAKPPAPKAAVLKPPAKVAKAVSRTPRKVRLPATGKSLKAHAAKAATAMKGSLAAAPQGGTAGKTSALKARPVNVGAAVFAKPQLDKARLKEAGVDPAKALRAAEQRRTQSGALVGAFMKRNSGKSATVQAMAHTLSAQVQGAAQTAKRNVQAASVKHASVLRASVVAARALASTQAGAARKQLDSQAQAALRALPKTTQAAKTKLTTAHAKEEQQVRAQATLQKAAVRAAFQSGATKYRAAGTTVGGEAAAHAEARASEYLGHVTGKNDSFLDGPLTDNRWKARADAARQVGQSYQQGYVEEGQKQATTLLGGMDKDLEAIDQTTQASLTGLSAQMTAAEQKLVADEAKAKSRVQQAQTQMAQAIQAQLQAVLAQLGSSEGAGLAAIAHAAAGQEQALGTQAAQATRSLQRSVDQIAEQLDQTLNSFGASVRGSQAPDPAALRKALAGAEGQIDKMVSGARAQLTQGLHTVTGSLASGAAAAQTSIGAVASSGAAQAKQTASGFARSSQALIGQAMATLTQLQHGYEQSSTASVQQTQEAFTAAGKSLTDLFEKARSGLDGKISASVEALMTQLRANFSQLDAAINTQADKAAAQVQPRWKGWAKIALMVAVIIVVAVVAGPLVIGAVGAMAGALGAGAAAGAIGMVVGGAIVGAAAGAATQIGNNAIDNIGVAAADQKSLFDGVGKAALIGGIGGVVGGAGGAIAQGLGKVGALGAGALTQKVAGFGVSTAFDLGGNVAGSMATGTSLSDSLKSLASPENLMMMAIGTGVGLSTAKLPGSVGKVQAGAHNMGERFGTHVGEGVANTTGYRGAPVPTRVNPELTGNSGRVTGYSDSRTQVEVSPNASPETVAAHQARGVDLRSENSLFQKVNNGVRETFGIEPTGRPAATEQSRLQHEAIKHQELADTYTRQAQEFPEGSLKRQQLQEEAAFARDHAEDYRQKASRTEPTEPDNVGSVESRLESGRNAAKRLGLPDAPAGQRWELYEGDVVPKLKSTDRTGPKMRHDPSDPLEPFKEIGEGMIPAERGPAQAQPWPRDVEGKLPEQVARAVDERARLVAERNDLEDRGLAATEADLVQLKQVRNQINDQSRIIGEHAGTTFVKGQYPEAELLYGGPESSSRSGDFDQVWKVKAEDGSPMYIVVEAKGGTSPLGDRVANASRAQQGSTEYFQSILENMSGNSNAGMNRTGRALERAYRSGDVKYFEVRSPISSSIEFKNGHPSVKNTVTEIVVKEFIIRPLSS